MLCVKYNLSTDLIIHVIRLADCGKCFIVMIRGIQNDLIYRHKWIYKN